MARRSYILDEIINIEELSEKVEDIEMLEDRKSSKEGSIPKTNAMSVYSVKKGICEATEFISDKTNEISAFPKLLKRLNIKNNIIVFDALNTQKETIEYIFNNDAFYVAPIKGNHKVLYEELGDYFNDVEFFNKVKNENYIETIEKRNGDAEIREYGFTNDVEWLYNKSEWIGLR